MDTEWETFLELSVKYMFWMICHVLLTEIFRFTVPKVSKNGHLLEIFLIFFSLIAESSDDSRNHWNCLCSFKL